VGSIPSEDLTSIQRQLYDDKLQQLKASELARFRKLNNAEVLRE
jgi:hypothetical protein